MSVINKTLVIVGYIVLGLLITLTLIYFILGWLSPDITAQDNSDLILSEIEIPQNNAYDDLSTVDWDMIKWPEYDEDTKKIDDMIDGKIWDEVFVTELVNNNIENLAVLERALTKESYQSTIQAVGNEFENESWSDETAGKTLRLSKIKVLQAMGDINKGNVSHGLSSLLNVAQLGYKIQYSRTHIISVIGAVKIKTDALTAINNNKEKLVFSDEDKNILSNLYNEDDSWYVNSVKMEFLPRINLDDADVIYKRMTGDDTVPLDYKIVANNSFFYKPNLTKKQYADHHRDIIKRSVVCGGSVAEETIPNKPKIFENNYIGKSQLSIVLVGLDSYSQTDCENKELIEQIFGLKSS